MKRVDGFFISIDGKAYATAKRALLADSIEKMKDLCLEIQSLNTNILIINYKDIMNKINKCTSKIIQNINLIIKELI